MTQKPSKILHSKKSNPKKPQNCKKQKDFYGMIDRLYLAILFFYALGMLKITQSFFAVEEFYRNAGHPTTNYTWAGCWVSAGAAISFLIYHVTKRLAKNFLQNNVAWEKEHLNREGDREYNVATQLYGVVYYFSGSAVFWLVLYAYQPEALPVSMGGRLDIRNFTTNWPQETHSYALVYFMISLGHHVERTLQHLAYKRQSKSFWTMLLHHVLTISLMSAIYSVRGFDSAYCVLLSHEVSDFFLYAIRFARELKDNDWMMKALYLPLVFTWFFTRGFVFIGKVCVPIFSDFAVEYQSPVFGMMWAIVTGLAILAVLNIYWGILILKMGYTKLVKKQNIIVGFNQEPSTKKQK